MIAPTRSTCLNISMVLQNGELPPTLLMQEKGKEIDEAIENLHLGGFGVVAGTGTGKTLSIRDIAKKILGQELRVDVVNRENDATDYTWTCNVIVVTPGVALHWLKAGVVSQKDLVIIDEIHQTSEHLELSMALGKRAECTTVWMSATVDAEVYAKYLESRTVIQCSAFDPQKKAKVECSYDQVEGFIRGHLTEFSRGRGVAVFVATRAEAENLARTFDGMNGIHAEFYHGGETVEKLRAFLRGQVPKPFMIFMTIAGASSLNILGLDTVVIQDEMYKEIVHSGVKVLEQVRLGNNELLQMGGRVNGRVAGGRIYILSSRDISFHELEPQQPDFVLGGDLDRVALTCARIGVNAGDLDLIGEINHVQYAKRVARFKKRGIIMEEGDELTSYGRQVEQLPVTPAWAEMLVHAAQSGDEDLLNITVVCSCIESLYSLGFNGFGINEFVVARSDHLTGYNAIAKALRDYGYISRNGDVQYKFRGDFKDRNTNKPGEFLAFCLGQHLRPKAIKEVVLAMKSVYQQLRLRLPRTESFVKVENEGSEEGLRGKFVKLLAKVQSLDFVKEGSHPTAGMVQTAKSSRTMGMNVLGTLRYWKDNFGYTKASIEGTEIPESLVEQEAKRQLSRFTGLSLDCEKLIGIFTLEFADTAFAHSKEVTEADVPADRQREAASFFADALAALIINEG